MTIKTLLLGSAAAVAVVGGAQAADLSVAEPVEYVKVCDYFGAGYWYIPGTDTCIKISGYVEENALFHSNAGITSVTYGFGPGGIFKVPFYHYSTWNMNTVVQMDVDTKSETEYGVLEGLISFGGGDHNYAIRGDSYGLGDDGAFVSLGGFKAGTYQLAAYVPGVYAFTDNNGPYNNEIYGTFGYDLLNTVQMSWNSGGISASIALSDPSTEFFNYGVLGPVAPSAPLITGNVGFGTKDATFNVSAGFLTNDSGYGTSFGIDGQAHFNLGPADSFELNAAFGDNGFIQNGWGYWGFNALGTNNGYSFLGGWQHNLSKTLAFQLVGSWAKFSGTSETGYAINGDLVWTPVTNFSVTGAVVYSSNTNPGDVSGAWVASLSVKRSW